MFGFVDSSLSRAPGGAPGGGVSPFAAAASALSSAAAAVAAVPLLPRSAMILPATGALAVGDGGRFTTVRSASMPGGPATLALRVGQLAYSYLEVAVTRTGAAPAGSFAPRRPAVVGVGMAVGGIDATRMPGWDAATIGYHSDDGKLYDGAGVSSIVLSAPWHAVGAVAGVGVLPGVTSDTLRLVFTRGGGVVAERVIPAVALGTLLLTVGVDGPSVEVALNTGQAPFMYAGAAGARLPHGGGGDEVAARPVPRGAGAGGGGGFGVAVAPRRGATAADVAALRGELADLAGRIAAAERAAAAADPARVRDLPAAELAALAARVTAAERAVTAARSDRVATTVAGITGDARLRAAARAAGVEIMRVAWEDAGRTKGSAFGPNISDMTLHACGKDMPIIRKPNFTDVTSDHDMDNFFLVVGNETPGGVKETVTLRTYLDNIGAYIGDPTAPSLVAGRDSKVLTSAQACVLPLRDGRVEFNVRLYNYQSVAEPAVLVIIASSEGTSAQVVLARDNFLRFNKAGSAADFVAERLTDDRIKRGVPVEGPMTAEERKRNCLLIIQVPLKRRVVARSATFGGGGGGGWGGPFSAAAGGGGGGMAEADGAFGCAYGAVAAPAAYAPVSGIRTKSSTTAPMSSASSRSRAAADMPARGIEAAMLSVSDERGPFRGTRGCRLVRDAAMPIRCTLQWYHVTDSADIPGDTMAAIAGQVTELYDAAAPWNRGSLVTGRATGRVTEKSPGAGAGVVLPVWPPVWYFGFPISCPRAWPPVAVVPIMGPGIVVAD